MSNTEFEMLTSLDHQNFVDSFDIYPEDSNMADLLTVPDTSKPSVSCNCNIPKPPPLPSKICSTSYAPRRLSGYSYVPKETKDVWNKIFEEGYRADVHILTKNNLIIPAHSNVLVSIFSTCH